MTDTSTPAARATADEADDALVEAAFRTGDFDAAAQRLERALNLSRESGDVATEAFALDRLGMVAHYRSIVRLVDGETVADADVAAEEALFRRALELRASMGDKAGTAQSLFGVGLVHQVLRDDADTAMQYFTSALSLAEEAGSSLDLYSRSEIHRHLGFSFLADGTDPARLDLALDHLRTSLELRERLGDPRRLPSALVALGQAEVAVGNRSGAVELLERAVVLARSAGLAPMWLQDAEQALAEVAGSAEAPGSAPG